MRGVRTMDEWPDRFRRYQGWLMGIGALLAWFGMLYLMFGDVL